MFFANRIYGKKVLSRIEELVLEYLGPSNGSEAMGGLLGVMSVFQDAGMLDPASVFKAYRKAGLSVDDAAIIFIDETIENLKQIVMRGVMLDKLNPLVALLERVIDKHMIKRPGLYVPVNGEFGEAASKHLSDFFSENTA